MPAECKDDQDVEGTPMPPAVESGRQQAVREADRGIDHVLVAVSNTLGQEQPDKCSVLELAEVGQFIVRSDRDVA